MPAAWFIIIFLFYTVVIRDIVETRKATLVVAQPCNRKCIWCEGARSGPHASSRTHSEHAADPSGENLGPWSVASCWTSGCLWNVDKCDVDTTVADLVGRQSDGAHAARGLSPTTASHQRLFTYSGCEIDYPFLTARSNDLISTQLFTKEDLLGITYWPKIFGRKSLATPLRFQKALSGHIIICTVEVMGM